MKLNYPLRFLVIVAVILGSALLWAKYGVDRGLDLRGGASLIYRLDLESIPPEARSDTLLSTVQVIEERINNLGLKDLKVDALPPDQFEVQFPGKESSDIDRIKGILTRLGKLEFRIVAMGAEADEGAPGFETDERKRKEEMGAAYPGPPPGYQWVPRRPSRDAAGADRAAGPPRLVEIPEGRIDADIAERLGRRKEFEGEIARLETQKSDPGTVATPERMAEIDRQIGTATAKIAEIDRQVAALEEQKADILKKNYFTGNDLDPGDLGIRPGEFGAGYVVAFATRARREADFGNFTERNVKRQMAIIIDGALESAPVIQEKLPGRGQISGGGMGGFSRDQAQDLVTVLRSGSLAVKLELQSEYAVGPSLGEAAIRNGLIASAIGMGLVVIFMVGSYLFAGGVAVLALLVNVLLIMASLAFFRAELSMPGIAGIILTVGMSVDANILVFERIREERAAGKSIAQAVKAGYSRAFITIVDANVTTLLTAFVLYSITSGQVRGFAITLICGILASMFTALYVTKTVFGALIDRGWLKDLRMTRIFFVPKVSYMKVRLPAIGISLLLIVLGVVLFSGSGPKKYDIEFLGGQRVVVQFREPVSITTVKDRVSATYADASVVSIKSTASSAQSALNLQIASDSFQITIAGADTEQERTEVLAFLERTFAENILPHGLTPLGPAEVPSGTPREYRISFEQAVSGEALGTALAAVGEKPELIEASGSTARIRVVTSEPEVFLENLDRALSSADLTTTEPFPMKSFVDPQTAQGHRDSAIKAVVISLILQIIYIYFRFHGASFGFAAVLALVHDTLITLGAIAFFGTTGLVNVKINLPIIAAILTLIGYSMNDTIVVFDRIRENLAKGRRNLSEVIDLSVNQTLARSVRTAVTTFFVVFVMFVVNYGAAASVLEGFGFTLMFGVITGTYSSVFIAAPLLLFLPWHYLRGRGLKFWGAVTLTIIGGIMLLFAEGQGAAFTGISLALLAVYPVYFLAEFVYWLFLPDPDRSLNLVLRGQTPRA
ncbi:MAG: protein translocase subunit SecD [Planctomycetes bacterium]|jgi:SecD/SecF fusion protein|nr:protein translocase subunit SecD [Planctomycetota bacterium]